MLKSRGVPLPHVFEHLVQALSIISCTAGDIGIDFLATLFFEQGNLSFQLLFGCGHPGISDRHIWFRKRLYNETTKKNDKWNCERMFFDADSTVP